MEQLEQSLVHKLQGRMCLPVGPWDSHAACGGQKLWNRSVGLCARLAAGLSRQQTVQTVLLPAFDSCPSPAWLAALAVPTGVFD